MSGSGEAQAQILVVDDEPTNLEILADTLYGHPWDVTAVNNGDAAMRMLVVNEPCFDLVILDRRMAAPDGMQILRFMRKTPHLQHTPVIMQTAAAEPTRVAEGIGANQIVDLSKGSRWICIRICEILEQDETVIIQYPCG